MTIVLSIKLISIRDAVLDFIGNVQLKNDDKYFNINFKFLAPIKYFENMSMCKKKSYGLTL